MNDVLHMLICSHHADKFPKQPMCDSVLYELSKAQPTFVSLVRSVIWCSSYFEPTLSKS